MNRINTLCTRLLAGGLLALLVATAQAANLPPPPVSPAPVTDYEYDAKGNPTKVIRAREVPGFGFTSSTSYDALDRVKDSTDARNGVTRLTHDGLDQLRQVSDPRSLVTSYARNGLGDLTQLSSPDTGAANSTFDANGNLLTRTDSRGAVATLSYDGLNRVTSTVHTLAGQPTITYTWTYDQTGGDFGFGVGRLTTATGPDGNTRYGYDQQGRVITEIQTVGADVYTTRYGYDAAGHVNRIVYPSGRTLFVDYRNGKPSALSYTLTDTSPVTPVISDIAYEPFGPVKSWVMPLASGPVTQERVRDQYGRLVRYPLNDVVRDLTYDAANRIISYTHLDAASGQMTAAAQALNQSFAYDETGRLTGISTPAASWTIAYDANGNRTSVVLNGTTRDYATESTSNRLSSLGSPIRSFSYDAAGNTLGDTGGYTTTYRADGRLGALTKGGVTTTYAYDAFGRRVRKQSGGVTSRYVYGLDGQLLAMPESNASQEYVWLGDTPVFVFNSSGPGFNPAWVFADHLNAPLVIIAKTGQLRWRWLSEPFGSGLAEDKPVSTLPAFPFPLRFPGQFYDKESGLHYNYFRDYDPTIGRYVQSDPIGLSGGVNTYAYVGARPTILADPLGLDSCRTLLNLGIVIVEQCIAPPPVPGRPQGLDSKETRYYDRHCKGSDDPCGALKIATNQAIAQARIKMDKMLNDDRVNGLFANAHSVPNPAVTGTNTTWIGHVDDLNGRTASIWTMIGLGRKMGCDMSAEAAAAITLYTPGAPL